MRVKSDGVEAYFFSVLRFYGKFKCGDRYEFVVGKIVVREENVFI